MNLPGYRILSEINQGSISSVFLAEDLKLKRRVLIKQLNRQWNDQPDLLERFRREATISSRLKHPNIIENHDIATIDGRLIMVFAFVEGVDLGKFQGGEALPFEAIAWITRELLEGLVYAHDSGIIHRDIKPGNIMAGVDGQVKITDFGLARTADLPSISMHGEVVGTPAYMSPEQARVSRLDHRTDLFSAGVTIYQLATGASPFYGDNIIQSIEKLVKLQPQPLHQLRQDIPEWFGGIIERLMAKKADDRPQSAREILQRPEWGIVALHPEPLAKAVQKIYTRPHYLQQPTPEPVSAGRFQMPAILTVLLLAALVSALAWLPGMQSGATNAGLEPLPQQATPPLPADTHAVISSPAAADSQALASAATETAGTRQPERMTIPERKPVQQPPANNSAKQSGPDVALTAENIQPPAIPEPAGLYIRCNPWGEVYIDGQRRDVTPMSAPLSLVQGNYQLEVRNPGFESYRRRITLAAGKIDTVEVLFKQQEGYLDLRVVPWAQIVLNGKYLETTPLTAPLALPAGTYRLELVNPGYATWSGEVVIAPRETTRQRITLTK